MVRPMIKINIKPLSGRSSIVDVVVVEVGVDFRVVLVD